MDLKEVKKIVAFAKKAGISSMTMDSLSFVFSSDPLPVLQKGQKVPEVPEKKLPEPKPGPTLDDINQYIYGQDDEEHA